MKPRQIVLLPLLFLLTASLGQAQTFGIATQDPQSVKETQWDIYWKNGSEWQRSGGFGTVSIRDNLKILATSDGDFSGLPETESSTVCFQSGGKIALNNCLDLSECPFFVVEQRAVNYTVWGPTHCATGEPGLISK